MSGNMVENQAEKTIVKYSIEEKFMIQMRNKKKKGNYELQNRGKSGSKQKT